MAVKEKSEYVREEIEWNVDTEVQLFYAMHGHKPVATFYLFTYLYIYFAGVNKHFQMACILEKFCNSINKEVSSKVIWDHLDTMYDMPALDDTENLPFPNDTKDFSLPEAEYADMMNEKVVQPVLENSVEADIEIKQEQKKESIKNNKDVVKKETNKDIKENTHKKDNKEIKEVVKDKKDKEGTKDPKRIVTKDVKESRRESKDGKESKKDNKKEIKETMKDTKKESSESKEAKHIKSRGSIKEKKESRKEEEKDEPLSNLILSARKERVRELSESKNDDSSPKRGAKRSTRGSIKPDDAGSNKSSSPITTPTPPPSKRRRT
ncbi:hypothetical protein L9F63_023021 [Diploptera punctata]|uniref:MRG-binding protein n=1 Tax=Diploptera punctata TaxID=6984 RepID=A0AAD8EA10_DIPPU|nr:hypothetical protein L9F63_023021 [Diploptera punctata]